MAVMNGDPTEHEGGAIVQTPDGDDLALLRRFVDRGDRAALGLLFSRHADAAYRFALRLSRNPTDAEDILQNAFLEVFRHASTYQGRASVRTWILGFVLYVSRNRSREEARRKARQDRAAAGAEVSTPPATVEPEVATRLRRAVEELPEHYRAPVWLHYGEGLSTDEVASVLDLSADTVRKQLSRGIDRLRNELLPLGAAMSVVAVLPTLAVETAPPSLLLGIAPGALPAAASGLKLGAASKLAAMATALIAIASSATLLWWGGDEQRPPEFATVASGNGSRRRRSAASTRPPGCGASATRSRCPGTAVGPWCC